MLSVSAWGPGGDKWGRGGVGGHSDVRRAGVAQGGHRALLKERGGRHPPACLMPDVMAWMPESVDWSAAELPLSYLSVQAGCPRGATPPRWW